MGTIFSSPSNPTSEPQPPSPAASPPPTMSSPHQEPKTLEENSNKPEKDNEEKSQEEGEEKENEEGECGFCVFMKGGGCREQFVNWENCVMESEKKGEDIVEKCHEITFKLKECMNAHADYYEPILKAERAAEEEVAKEMEKERLLEEQSGEDGKKSDATSGNDTSSDNQEKVN